MILLRDAEGIAPEPVLIPATLGPLLGRLDGERTIERIALEVAAPQELIEGFVAEMVSLGFIETAESLARSRALALDYHLQPVREAALAGAVYPSDPNELRSNLADYLKRTERRFMQPAAERVTALVCPHIDYRRGWQGYGAAYTALPVDPPPEVIILIGTSHQASDGLFHLTLKDFATPIGVAPNARELVSQLADRFGRERSFREERLHRREHSLELQLPFLLHRYQGGATPLIVPILVGSFHQYLIDGTEPSTGGEAGDFIGALTELLRELRLSNRRVLVYGGIDLAHVGLHFGDRDRVAETRLGHIELRDRELLDRVLRADEAALFAHMAEDLDARRICGFPSMYVMLAALRGAGARLTGHLIDYRQAVDARSDCVVTFASACWTEPYSMTA